jgi:FkbM family methyltransferase
MGKIKRTFGFIFNHPLGKRHPVKALLRFLLWQLQSSFAPGKFIVKSFIPPVKFYARRGLTGITGNIYAGLHEFDDMAFLLHFLRPGDLFFDIGANAGSYTLLAAGVCGATAVAIEPAKNTADILSKNIQLNNLQQKVSLVNAVAGATIGTVTFTENQDTTNHVFAADELQTGTIDSLLAQGTPSLIKIDVEGYETEVLNGMYQTLRQPALKAIIIELNGSGARYGFDEEKIHVLLTQLGFTPHNYDPFKRVLHQIDKHGDYNTIYCRDIPFVNDRLKNSKAINIMGELI